LLDHVATSLSARQASEEKLRRFVADASHELRTPLASIRGYAELTRRSPEVLPEQAAHTISRIESESVRMTSLVEDLLLLARLDEGDRMRRDPVDLTQLLADAMSDAQAAGPAHRWKLLLPPKPVVVSGDQLRLHQVIANLFSNARTHTPEGTLVTASLRVEDTAALLEVRDTGPGIDGVIIDTLFERFVRADTARSRNTGSTGLGLAITAAIITAHNGTISVASEPGNTVFTVTLQTAKRD
jgi:two-component system OmpR family sensor kinase